MVEFSCRRPDTRLSPFVKMYFWGKDDSPPLIQRTVPNGEMGLCFYRNSSVIYKGVGDIQSCIAGQSTIFQDIISKGPIEIVVAHFTTIGAHLFFNMPLNILFGRISRLGEVEDTGLSVLEEKIMLAPDYHACWDELDSFFLQRLDVNNDDLLNLKRLQRAVAYGQRNPAESNVVEAASSACLSTRHFNRLFSKTIGMPPKDFLRIKRFHYALKNLKDLYMTDKSHYSLTDIACKSGYYDLSHMSSEFLSITGLSPKKLLAVSQNDNDSVGWRM
ncbi:MAG: helix-turn-helix domain-containing protein [Candidatus Limimorpha sp.]